MANGGAWTLCARAGGGQGAARRTLLPLRATLWYPVAPMSTAPKGPVRLIKRYGNRKLYDVEASRYVTLDAIRVLVQGGEDVRVVDNDSGEDLTRLTFAQIIYEAEDERRQRHAVPAVAPAVGAIRR
jgi:hypothetical protein